MQERDQEHAGCAVPPSSILGSVILTKILFREKDFGHERHSSMLSKYHSMISVIIGYGPF